MTHQVKVIVDVLNQQPDTIESLRQKLSDCQREHKELFDGNYALVQELAALKQSQGEPVAWMYVNTDGECEQIEYGKDSPCEGFTPLYTATTIPEEWQLVPIQPTDK